MSKKEKEKDHIKLTSVLIEAALSGDLVTVKKCIEEDAMSVDAKPFCQTALLAACQTGKIDVIKYLVGKGADVEFTNLWGENPLGVAEQSGSADAVSIVKSAILLKNL